jgi:oligoribonuclease NrnB/cAMP/cGMP phosphodiesterase (DHH superfamily)
MCAACLLIYPCSVVVLDHHKTALEHLSDLGSLPGNVHLLLDMGRSGATLARDFFQPRLTDGLGTIFR